MSLGKKLKKNVLNETKLVPIITIIIRGKHGERLNLMTYVLTRLLSVLKELLPS